MPNKDYILRSDAVSAFCGNCEGTEVCRQLGEPCEEVKRIKAIPAADVEPKRKWIPVTEGLPKRPENWPRCEIRRCYFLVALESGCVKSLGFEFATMEWHPVGSPVTHWTPLPEPPKEANV